MTPLHARSKECGHKLADSIVDFFLGVQDPDQAPNMTSARAVGCELPGGLVFMMAGTPRVMISPSLQPPEGGERLQTATARGFMALVLDAEQRVQTVAYLGKNDMQMPVSCLCMRRCGCGCAGCTPLPELSSCG